MTKYIKILSRILLAFVLIALPACNKGNGADEAVAAIEDATKRIKEAKTVEQRMTITQELSKTMKELNEKYPQDKLTDEEKARVTKATQEFLITVVNANTEEPIKKMKDNIKETGSPVLDSTSN